MGKMTSEEKELAIIALFEFGYADTIIAARVEVPVEMVVEIREKRIK